MLFSVEPVTIRGQVVLRVHGELDLATVAELKDAVSAQLPAQLTTLYLDLTDTSFMDSTGARELTRSARAAAERGTALQIICPLENTHLWRVIDLLDLRAGLDIVEAADFPTHEAGS